MILFLVNTQGNVTGGELYAARIHEFLKNNYDNVIPDSLSKLSTELLNPLRHARRALEEVKEKKPAVVVIDLYSGCRNTFAVRWLKKRDGVVVTIVSGLREKYRYNSNISRKIAKKCESYILKKSDIVITISDYLGEYVCRFTDPKAKIIVAKPGIKIEYNRINESKAIARTPVAKVNLLTIGACNIVKGTKYIVTAMSHLQDLNVMLDLVGPYDTQDSYYIEVNDIIERNNLRDRVKFHGFLGKQDLSRLFLDCDIYVLPSLFEGYGIVIAEAITYGLPIVATNVGAIPELIQNGVNGILVNPGDSRALATAIRKLICDYELRAKMRKNNIEKSGNLPTWTTFESTLKRELLPELRAYLQ